jgi:hypothetical protein
MAVALAVALAGLAVAATTHREARRFAVFID